MNSAPPKAWALTKTPRDWQSKALDNWRTSFRGVASVVTGGGKTTFAQMCMQVFRERYPDGRFVIVVPTLALLDQWYVSLREDLAIPEHEMALFSGEGRPERFRTVNLMVVNTARVYAPKVSEEYDTMLVVDECHRSASESNALALKGDHEGTLGISATPERAYDDLFEDVVVPALGPIIFRYDYNDALSDDVIVPFDIVNVYTDMTAEEQSEYDELTSEISRTFRGFQAGEVSKDTLTRKLRHRARLAATSIQRIPIAALLAERHRTGRLIIFHEDIRSAEKIWRILLARGFNATIYHSKIGPALRRDNLRLYRRGVFDVLVTCRALDEGVNVPETDVAILASSTASPRQRIQRMGRVLRPAPGKPRARIYTIYVSKVEESRLSEEAARLSEASSIGWMRSRLRARNADAI